MLLLLCVCISPPQIFVSRVFPCVSEFEECRRVSTYICICIRVCVCVCVCVFVCIATFELFKIHLKRYVYYYQIYYV